MKKQITYALLAALAISAFASCGSEPAKKPEDTKTKDTEKKTETTEPADPYASYIDGLPEDLDLEGKTITFGCMEAPFLKYDIGVDKPAGEIITDAVYERNLNVMERLNCKIAADNRQINWGDWSNLVKQSVMAGDHYWDVIDIKTNAALQVNISYCFMDLSEVDYLDIEKEYWNTESIKELSVDGKSYQFLIGEGQLMSLMEGACTFFNKDMYASLYEDPNELYQLATDGKWTLDVLQKCCMDAYHDVDGGGTVDEGDRMGLWLYHDYAESKILEFGCIYRRISRDEDGMPYPDYDMQAASDVHDKLVSLFHETPGIHVANDDMISRYDSADMSFLNGNAMFQLWRLSYALGSVRNMEDAYGIIPVPKFDENQTNYRGIDEGTFWCVPLTETDPDSVGAVLEALTSESHENVIVKFYEEALMAKYSPDEDASKAIKMVADSCGVDFSFCYNSLMSGLGWMPYQKAYSGEPLVSSMERYQKMAVRALKWNIEEMQKIFDEQ